MTGRERGHRKRVRLAIGTRDKLDRRIDMKKHEIIKGQEDCVETVIGCSVPTDRFQRRGPEGQRGVDSNTFSSFPLTCYPIF